jgi:hypothetical protein
MLAALAFWPVTAAEGFSGTKDVNRRAGKEKEKKETKKHLTNGIKLRHVDEDIEVYS